MHAIVTAEPQPLEQLNPSLPPEFVALVRRAMRRSPELRFASVKELGRALLPFATPVVRARWAPELEQIEQRGIDDTAVSLEVLARPSQIVSAQLAQASSSSAAAAVRRVLGIVVVAAALVVLLLAWLDRRARQAPVEAVAKPPAPVVLSDAPSARVAAPAPVPAPIEAASAAPSAKPTPPARSRARSVAPLATRATPAAPSTRHEIGTNDAPIIE
jgi:hypothetical protein